MTPVDFVLTVSSSVTAGGVMYLAKAAHDVRQTVEANRERSEQNEERSQQNKERSLVHRAVLAREGLMQHDPRNTEDTDGGV